MNAFDSRTDARPGGLPTTIPEYLEHLRRSLAGADPALVQDALYDAEEYLRSELAENPGKSEADVIVTVAGSYGAPDEVADIYRDTEVKVQTALRPPAPKPRRSWMGHFFGVIAEPRTYGALFYMVQGLSSFLRHSLDNDPMQRVTLRQELDALTLYLDIEKIRFAERLRIETDIDEDCWRALLPSLLMQPLVENAIKYAVAKQVAGGLLRIEAERDGEQLVLRVIDDGPGCTSLEGNQLPPGKGVGLRNTRERLNVLYGEESSFSVRNRERGIEVELRLPFETKLLGGE